MGDDVVNVFADEFDLADKQGPGCTISIAVMYVAIQALTQRV